MTTVTLCHIGMLHREQPGSGVVPVFSCRAQSQPRQLCAEQMMETPTPPLSHMEPEQSQDANTALLPAHPRLFPPDMALCFPLDTARDQKH
jgi:hypothetical protein